MQPDQTFDLFPLIVKISLKTLVILTILLFCLWLFSLANLHIFNCLIISDFFFMCPFRSVQPLCFYESGRTNQWGESTCLIGIFKTMKAFSTTFSLGGFGGPEKDHIVVCGTASGSLPMGSSCQLHILWNCGNPPCMYGTQVCVLK